MLPEDMSILARRTREPSGNRRRAAPYALEQVEVLLDRTTAPRALRARLGEGAAMLADLIGRQVIDVCMTLAE